MVLVPVLASAQEQARSESIDVEMLNIQAGIRFIKSGVIVAFHVSSKDVIELIQMNGAEVRIIPGRRTMRLSQRIFLFEGLNDIIIRVLGGQAISKSGAKVAQTR